MVTMGLGTSGTRSGPAPSPRCQSLCCFTPLAEGGGHPRGRVGSAASGLTVYPACLLGHLLVSQSS